MPSKKLLLEKNPILLYADTGARLLQTNASKHSPKTERKSAERKSAERKSAERKSAERKSAERKSTRVRKVAPPPMSPLPPPKKARRTVSKSRALA